MQFHKSTGNPSAFFMAIQAAAPVELAQAAIKNGATIGKWIF
jgi:hypothetical protein